MDLGNGCRCRHSMSVASLTCLSNVAYILMYTPIASGWVLSQISCGNRLNVAISTESLTDGGDYFTNLAPHRTLWLEVLGATVEMRWRIWYILAFDRSEVPFSSHCLQFRAWQWRRPSLERGGWDILQLCRVFHLNGCHSLSWYFTSALLSDFNNWATISKWPFLVA